MNYTGLGKCAVCDLVVPVANGHDVGAGRDIYACVDHPDKKGIQCRGFGKEPVWVLTAEKTPEVWHWVGFFGDCDRYCVARSRFVIREGKIIGYDEASFPAPRIQEAIQWASALISFRVRLAREENTPVLYIVCFEPGGNPERGDNESYNVDRLTVWAPGHKPEESWHRRRTILSMLGFMDACKLANNANRNIT